MSNEHPIDNLLKNTMENLKSMIDVNTIIGDAVQTKDGACIIPISKVSFGFASGGSEFSSQQPADTALSDYPFGGGSGAGVTVKPVAFLVVNKDNIRLLPVDSASTYDRAIDTLPQILDMLKNMFSKKNNCKCKDGDSEADTETQVP